MVGGTAKLVTVPFWHAMDEPIFPLSKNVGDDLVGERGDLVLEHQLALLQSRNLDLVDRTGSEEPVNLFIESAMLGFEQDQYLLRIVVVHRVGLAEAVVGVTRPP